MQVRGYLTYGAIVLVSILNLTCLSAALAASTTPPPTHTNTVEASDPYRWLEADSPERKTWIRAQNRQTKTYLKNLKSRSVVEEFFRKLDDNPMPVMAQPVGDDQLIVIYQGLGKSTRLERKSADGTSSVLFDTADLKENGSIAVTGLSVSPDKKFAVLATAEAGSTDENTLRVIDLTTNQVVETIEKSADSRVTWTAVDRFVYGLILKNEVLGVQHHIGSDASADTIFSRNPEAYVSNSTLDGEAWVFVESDAGTRMRRVLDSQWYQTDELMSDAIGVVGDTLYFTNGIRKSLGQIKKLHLDPSRKSLKAQVVVPESSMGIRSASLEKSRILVTYQMGATQKIVVMDLAGKPIHSLILPPVASVESVSYDSEKDQLKLNLTSQITDKEYTYDFATRAYIDGNPEQDLLERDGIAYVSEVVNVSSANSMQVPVRITYKKGLQLNGGNPGLIEGYGGFAISGNFDPVASSTIRQFMRLGGVYIAPALRGGPELGGPWHVGGMGEHKQNVFNDLIATAEYVIQRGYTSAARLAVMGASNGGLLVSAVATQRPDLFRLAIPIAGLHDMLRKERLNPSFNDGWSDEYGNSDIVADFKTLEAYSPIHNLKKQAYPTFLIVAGENDSRVNPAHSYKLAGALQAMQTGPNPILLSSYKNAGHFLKAPPRQGLIAWRVQVSIWSMICDELGVDLEPTPQ